MRRTSGAWGSRVALLALAVVIAVSSPSESGQRPLLDPLPDRYRARIETRERFLAARAIQPTGALSFVIERSKSWNPGAKLRIAFAGGDDAVRQRIADVASRWLQHANLTFEFKDAGRFRQWGPSDTAHAAEIRVGFDQGGYWSLVGRDSVDPAIVGANEASLNLESFDSFPPAEPEFTATVLHEFGHALAFHHEHQHPLGGCDAEYRWFDDPGYVPTRNQQGGYVDDVGGRQPGIYTVLGGSPNYWPASKVDVNLKQLPPSSAFELGGFDLKSIMKYHFPEWMYRRGRDSQCYSDENADLSDVDKAGASKVYPRAGAARSAILGEKTKYFAEMAATKDLPASFTEIFKSQLEEAKQLMNLP